MNCITREYIIEQLKSRNPKELFEAADKLRRDYCSESVHIRGIIEFSNYCKRDCLYCGLRRSNRSLTRYRLDEKEILDTASKAGGLGYKTILLQSGEDEYYTAEKLRSIIRSIKREVDCAITLSVGEKSLDDYKSLRDAGADRYLLRFETSDKKLFEKLKPDSSYTERLSCIEDLSRLGYQTGSGIMVGLPGQTAETLADDILLMERLNLDMLGIGPFIPHYNTPLSGKRPGTLDMTLRTLALIRLAMPDTHIPATTAMGSVDKEGRQKALSCGANVIMPNITPSKYRKLYEIYPNKICMDEDPVSCRLCVESMLKFLGRGISTDYGHTLKRPLKASI